jgi:hypothetical protein
VLLEKGLVPNPSLGVFGAIHNDQDALLEYLIHNGSEVNVQDDLCRTPLMLVAGKTDFAETKAAKSLAQRADALSKTTKVKPPFTTQRRV